MAKKPVLTPEQAKSNALETALTTIERKFGKGSVMRLKDQAIEKIPVIPTRKCRKRAAPAPSLTRNTPWT